MSEETSRIALPIRHSQSVERYVSFAEASARVARFDRRDKSFDKKIKFHKLGKHLTPKSSSNNEFK